MIHLPSIAKQAGEQLAGLVGEAEDEIKAALAACAEEAQAQETEAKLKLRFVITINMDKDIAQYSLSFGVTRKLDSAAQLPDPNQLEIKFGEEPTE